MTRILAALILSTAAIGAAQAGELGYLDNPGAQTHSSISRAQVQQELVQARAQQSIADTGNGELVNVAKVPQTTTTQLTRSDVQRDLSQARNLHSLNGNGELDSPVFAG
jgi:hypothetical protein